MSAKPLILEFPDVPNMANFIVNMGGLKVEIDSFECILKGLFSDDLIAIAQNQYGAKASQWKKISTVNQMPYTFS